jgi:drug/metabolite transporter (DMT)-like permease
MPVPSHRSGVLLVAAGATLWGTDTVLRQPLTHTLSSTAIVFYEHLILAVVVAPALIATRKAWTMLNARQWAAIVGLSWGGSALATVCFTMAVQTGNPTTAVLLQKIQPVFTFLLAGVVLGERPRSSHWMFLIIAAAGAYLISFGGSGLWPTLRPVDINSALLALAAAALWGSSTVLGRYVSASISFTAVTALRIVVALPLLALLNLPEGPPLPHEGQWVKLIWLALVPGLAALLLYYRGLRSTPAPVAAVAELCFPATTALLNWVFLGSQLTTWQIAGFLIIWAVVGRLTYSTRKDRIEDHG